MTEQNTRQIFMFLALRLYLLVSPPAQPAISNLIRCQYKTCEHARARAFIGRKEHRAVAAAATLIGPLYQKRGRGYQKLRPEK